MKLNTYETPSVRLYEVKLQGMLLTSTKNVESMTSVQGSWDEESRVADLP